MTSTTTTKQEFSTETKQKKKKDTLLISSEKRPSPKIKIDLCTRVSSSLSFVHQILIVFSRLFLWRLFFLSLFFSVNVSRHTEVTTVLSCLSFFVVLT